MAPASLPTLVQAPGGSEIGTWIPEAGDPKVRAATRRAASVVPESGGVGLGMEGGAMHSLFLDRVCWGCPLWGEISAGPDRGQISVGPEGGDLYGVSYLCAL